jgi:hypothetical protein
MQNNNIDIKFNEKNENQMSSTDIYTKGFMFFFAMYYILFFLYEGVDTTKIRSLFSQLFSFSNIIDTNSSTQTGTKWNIK